MQFAVVRLLSWIQISNHNAAPNLYHVHLDIVQSGALLLSFHRWKTRYTRIISCHYRYYFVKCALAAFWIAQIVFQLILSRIYIEVRFFRNSLCCRFEQRWRMLQFPIEDNVVLWSETEEMHSIRIQRFVTNIFIGHSFWDFFRTSFCMGNFSLWHLYFDLEYFLVLFILVVQFRNETM